jgi:type II secretory pathway component PulK
MNIPTRDELRAAYRQGEEASIQLFERLIQKLQVQRDRLKKNSKNVIDAILSAAAGEERGEINEAVINVGSGKKMSSANL